MGRPASIAVLAIALTTGCAAATIRPFADRPIVWRDPDLDAHGERPDAERSRAVWDAADGLVFRETIRTLELELPRESVDVNAWDEVPDSSWFTNRIGRTPMTPDELARGACADVAMPPTPWRVLEAKTDGVQPGFFFEDAAGVRHLLKTDGELQPERSTSADVVVAALLHAIGYTTPCNRIVVFDAQDVVADPSVPEDQVRAVLAAAARTHDGRLRASTSELFDAAPLGPWSYQGRWSADPRDRVPHELRRPVRALRWAFAWVDHVDARAHNTLALWEGGERGIVRHALLDFGDSFGARTSDARRSARYGHTDWLAIGPAVEDLLTLGLLPRPWYRELPEGDPVIGDLAHEPFDPDRWRPNYANGAFERADAHDAAWIARALARIGPEHLRAVVARARLSDPASERALIEALLARRDAILEQHLTALSPLAWPEVRGDAVCFEDLAVRAGIRDAADRIDAVRARSFPGDRPIDAATSREGAIVCATLRDPAPYAIVEIVTRDRDREVALRAHLRTDGALRVIGLERIAP